MIGSPSATEPGGLLAGVTAGLEIIGALVTGALATIRLGVCLAIDCGVVSTIRELPLGRPRRAPELLKPRLPPAAPRIDGLAEVASELLR